MAPALLFLLWLQQSPLVGQNRRSTRHWGSIRAHGGAVQTDLDVGALSERAGRLAEENQVLRADVALLMQSLKEQQGMARDYESALAKALGALRAAAFESHVEVGSVQEKYRVLLQSEGVLNARLAEENAGLRGALSGAAAAIRAAMDAADHPDNSSAVL
ncbi:hypothetical protein BX661DRAFT_56924 [Kickxella alabastrina]|uniref:uncharacterized protein n=1 Tax=Kickxella alabastrina TaxID=61397 RepID=UPI002220D19B|nr:uncharacterized protein BX661DRAFT_56924 [Kickxella alabastrina]KAI7823093.1 hypothetical protein BX661DRAFT_56924 [Kickxella alabastrina]